MSRHIGPALPGSTRPSRHKRRRELSLVSATVVEAVDRRRDGKHMFLPQKKNPGGEGPLVFKEDIITTVYRQASLLFEKGLSPAPS